MEWIFLLFLCFISHSFLEEKSVYFCLIINLYFLHQNCLSNSVSFLAVFLCMVNGTEGEKHSCLYVGEIKQTRNFIYLGIKPCLLQLYFPSVSLLHGSSPRFFLFKILCFLSDSCY